MAIRAAIRREFDRIRTIFREFGKKKCSECHSCGNSIPEYLAFYNINNGFRRETPRTTGCQKFLEFYQAALPTFLAFHAIFLEFYQAFFLFIFL